MNIFYSPIRLSINFLPIFIIILSIFTASISSTSLAGEKGNVNKSTGYAYFMNAIIEKEAGHFKKAVELFQMSLQTLPSERDVLLELSDTYMAMKDFKRASFWARVASSVAPSDVTVLMLLARAYAFQGEFKEAITSLEKVTTLDPQNKEAYLLLGNIYMEVKDYKKAINALERSIEEKDHPHSFMVYYYLGKLNIEIKAWNKAEVYLKKAILINPNMDDAIYSLAKVYTEKGDYREADGLFIRYLRRRPDDLRAKYEYFMLLLRANDIKKATRVLNELSSHATFDMAFGLKVAVAWMDLKKYAKAISILRQLERFYPNASQIRFYLAIAYEGLGEIDTAKGLYEGIKEGDAVFYLAQLRLSKILTHSGEYDRAIEILKGIINALNSQAHNPHIPIRLNEVYVELAITTDAKGDKKGAILIAKEGLKKFSDDPLLLNFIGYAYAEKGERLDEAEAMIKKALKNAPNDGFIIDSLGWVYFKQGRIYKAITELKRAVMLVPDDPTINEHLGDAYWETEEYDSAYTYFKRAYELFKEEKDKKRVEEKMDDAYDATQEFMSF